MISLTNLPKKEVLRYLGWKGTEIPPALDATIERCMEETCRLSSPVYIYRRFSIARETKGIRLLHTPYTLEGADIAAHLLGCKELYLMCATLGLGIDREIRRRMLTIPEEAIILDACATAAIEETADLAEAEIAHICKQEGAGITWRFSPGYGDLPLQTQKWLLPLMDTQRKMGLTLTESLLMTPGKSVSAILGVTHIPPSQKKATPGDTKNPCERCPNRETCAYRKRGEHC